MNRTAKGNFITRDHPYVYLGGSLIALLGLSLLAGESHPLSFLTDNLPGILCRIILWGFLALSALALVIKLTNWKSYRSSFLCMPRMKLFSRWFSYFVVFACLLALLDRGLLQLIYTVQLCMELEKNPQGFGSSMIYMSVKSKDILLAGVWTTVRIALLGTAIAFVLSIFMVFLRIQEPDKRDNDFVKALKWLASHFSRFYIFVIRGTPMMVQALIFYYFGFNLFKCLFVSFISTSHYLIRIHHCIPVIINIYINIVKFTLLDIDYLIGFRMSRTYDTNITIKTCIKINLIKTIQFK